MKKIYFAVMFVAVLMMTGCTKISTNKLQGLWSSPSEYSEPWYGSGSGTYYPGYHYRNLVIEFVNSNTLYNYVDVEDNRSNLEYFWGNDIKSVSGHSGWYYYLKETYTYVFSDNKVIVSNGDIYTYMDGKLYKDGSSKVLSPW